MSGVFQPVSQLSESDEDTKDKVPKAKPKPKSSKSKAKPKASPNAASSKRKASPKAAPAKTESGKCKAKPKASKPKACPKAAPAQDEGSLDGEADAAFTTPEKNPGSPAGSAAKSKPAQSMKKPAAAVKKLKRPAAAVAADGGGMDPDHQQRRVSSVYLYRATGKFACKLNDKQVFTVPCFSIVFAGASCFFIVFSVFQLILLALRLVDLITPRRSSRRLQSAAQVSVPCSSQVPCSFQSSLFIPVRSQGDWQGTFGAR